MFLVLYVAVVFVVAARGMDITLANGPSSRFECPQALTKSD